jgi:membrane protein insertase Oxa1/YidC/SpoIIIJ
MSWNNIAFKIFILYFLLATVMDFIRSKYFSYAAIGCQETTLSTTFKLANFYVSNINLLLMVVVAVLTIANIFVTIFRKGPNVKEKIQKCFLYLLLVLVLFVVFRITQALFGIDFAVLCLPRSGSNVDPLPFSL